MTEQMRAWISAAQVHRWHDLDNDIRHALNTTWSMACEGTAMEILAAVRLVGPTPPGHVPWTLLAGGVYAALLDVAGVTYDETEWLAWERRMSRHGGTVSACLEVFGGSVAAIRRDADELRANAADFEADFMPVAAAGGERTSGD